MPEKATYAFVAEKVEAWLEEETKRYYAANPTSMERFNIIMAMEDAQNCAHLLGVREADIIRGCLKGIPSQYQQDYLDTVYDKGVLFGGDADAIAQEFNLVPPTLGV